MEKQCGKCEKLLPATTEYFRKFKKGLYGLSAWCKECGKAYDREYREKNKEKRSTQIKEWQKNNPDYNKEYYAENKESEKERTRKYYEANKERYQEIWREWGRNNKDKRAAKSQRRRSRLAALPADLTEEQWEFTLLFFNNSCAYCESPESIQREHFIALASGGAYTFNNIIPACKSCNSSKRDNSFFDWYPKQLRYSKDREDKILAFIEGE